MLSFTSYTKVGLRLATFAGFLISGISFLLALVYLVMKLVYWDRFIAGSAPMLILTCFFGGVQLFFIGLLGEYIMSMNARIMNRPLVVEEKRLNFEKQEERDGNGKKIKNCMGKPGQMDFSGNTDYFFRADK